MGLIQREIEKRGIPTIGISIVRHYSEAVQPPRTLYVKMPFGHPLGAPFDIDQQMFILKFALQALHKMTVHGEILDLPIQAIP